MTFFSFARIKVIRDWVRRYERLLTPGALLVGFFIDSITLNRIDQVFDLLVLVTYLVIAALGIALHNVVSEGKLTGRTWQLLGPFLPLVVQFAFGGLFSGFLVFYGRSASLASTWLFVLILVGLLVGNEWFKRHYERFRFQVAIYFVTLVSFLIFYLPILIKTIGPWVFLFSIFIAIIVLAILLVIFARFLPQRVYSATPTIAISVAGISAAFIGLYFLNLIPPLPLSLKDAGIYHSITRVGPDAYEVTYEPKLWYQTHRAYNPVFHRAPGEAIYVFSAVFAPTDLSATLLHRWQRYEEGAGEWITESTISFPIVGGRDDGYRGYTMKSNVEPGKWRVDVLTRHGQLVGRIPFEVRAAEGVVELETDVR